MTNIEWTDETWNPTAGCSKVSEGCQNCYALRMANRLAGIAATKEKYEGLTRRTAKGELQWTGKITLDESALELPFKWKKPKKIFVDSMGDLFHPSIPWEYIDQVFAVIYANQHHTFQVLTKYSHELFLYFRDLNTLFRIFEIAAEKYPNTTPKGVFVPFLNLWVGASVENMDAAGGKTVINFDGVPAWRTFLSCEPLLGNIDLHDFFLDSNSSKKIDWVIAGGESGPNARPVHPDWVRSLRDQCKAAGVPFFFKQWGEWIPMDQMSDDQYSNSTKSADVGHGISSSTVFRVGKKAAGNYLDGVQHLDFPDSPTFSLSTLELI